MNTNDAVKFLSAFNYKYRTDANGIVVSVDSKLDVALTFHNDKFVKYTDSLKGWNPISGIFSLSLHQSLWYNTIGLIIVFVILELLKFSKYSYDFTYLLIIAVALNFMWFFYFHIKLEGFKNRIESWSAAKA